MRIEFEEVNMDALEKEGWEKHDNSEEKYYTWHNIKTSTGKLCQYSWSEAVTVQNGWGWKSKENSLNANGW